MHRGGCLELYDAVVTTEIKLKQTLKQLRQTATVVVVVIVVVVVVVVVVELTDLRGISWIK